MLCSLAIWIFWIFLAYKFLDMLIRIPKRTSPSSVVKNVMITGCDSGFGRLFAQRMAEKGFTVYASCLTLTGREQLQKGHPNVKTFMMDVRSTESIEEAYCFVRDNIQHGEGLWALVNNAGVPNPKAGPTEWLIKKDYTDCCDVNLFGLIDVTRTFLPLLKVTQGRIVNTSSVVGRMGFPGSGPYNVSKYGVEGFSDCLRPEIRAFGISVHIVEPGFHATQLSSVDTINTATQQAWDRLPQHLKDAYGEQYLHKVHKMMSEFIFKVASTNISDVVDCYEHAVLSYFPRGRYLPGKDAKFVWWPISKLPEWLFDIIMTSDPNFPTPDSVTHKT